MSKFSELIHGDKPVLVDFYAQWCGPCKMMAPQLENLASRLDGKARIIKVDIDKNPDAANVYRIRSVPTLILFRKGEAVWRQSGMFNATELENIINQYS